jgi:hypothetical protein
MKNQYFEKPPPEALYPIWAKNPMGQNNVEFKGLMIIII